MCAYACFICGHCELAVCLAERSYLLSLTEGRKVTTRWASGREVRNELLGLPTSYQADNATAIAAAESVSGHANERLF